MKCNWFVRRSTRWSKPTWRSSRSRFLPRARHCARATFADNRAWQVRRRGHPSPPTARTGQRRRSPGRHGRPASPSGPSTSSSTGHRHGHQCLQRHHVRPGWSGRSYPPAPSSASGAARPPSPDAAASPGAPGPSAAPSAAITGTPFPAAVPPRPGPGRLPIPASPEHRQPWAW